MFTEADCLRGINIRLNSFGNFKRLDFRYPITNKNDPPLRVVFVLPFQPNSKLRHRGYAKPCAAAVICRRKNSPVDCFFVAIQWAAGRQRQPLKECHRFESCLRRQNNRSPNRVAGCFFIWSRRELRHRGYAKPCVRFCSWGNFHNRLQNDVDIQKAVVYT